MNEPVLAPFPSSSSPGAAPRRRDGAAREPPLLPGRRLALGRRTLCPTGAGRCPSCLGSRYSAAGWSLAATLEGRPSLGEGGKVQIEGEVGSGCGWAEGVLPGGGPCPGPTPSRPSSSAPILQPHPQTRASGPAALTTHPWPERSEGLLSPSRAAGEVAARDSLPDWGRCRPLVGGGGEGRGAREDAPRPAHPRGGAGGGAGYLGAAPPGLGV